MKLALQSIYENPKYAKVFEWGKLISITGGTQVVVQALGFISGIIIIRLLPTSEYALYTLANTMLGTMTMLADSGISSGVMAEGGKVWQDKKQLGVVLATGLALKKKFGLISLILTTPVLVYLLLSHGANWLTIALIVISIVPAFFAALTDSFLEMAPKLHQSINSLQRNQAEVSLGRAALSAMFIFFFPFTFVALLANSIPRIYGNYKLRKISARYASDTEQPDANVKKAVSIGINRTLPIVIYHAISGQLSIWLMSIFGTTANIAELGALGRIAVLYNLITILFSTLVVPRFSRMKADNNNILKNFLIIQGASFVIGVAIVVGTWIFDSQILWLLGGKYSNLQYELLLFAIINSLGLMSTVVSQITISRGWFLKPFYFIGINFLSTLGFFVFFDVSLMVNVLWYTIAATSMTYSCLLIYGLINCMRIAKNSSKVIVR